MSIYHYYCSCVNCKKELTTQSLKAHYIKCTVPKAKCQQCGSNIWVNINKFCGSSCAATYVIKNRTVEQQTQINIKRKKTWTNKRLVKAPIKMHSLYCAMCSNLFLNKSKHIQTCSPACKARHISLKMRRRIYDGFDPNTNRGRGKQSYLERSFEQWLVEQGISDYVCEAKFKRLDMIKTYYVDFYFPNENLVIELDGTQHNTEKAKIYDQQRDQYISDTYDLKVLRISHQEYLKKTKLAEICDLLELQTGIEPA